MRLVRMLGLEAAMPLVLFGAERAYELKLRNGLARDKDELLANVPARKVGSQNSDTLETRIRNSFRPAAGEEFRLVRGEDDPAIESLSLFYMNFQVARANSGPASHDNHLRRSVVAGRQPPMPSFG